MINLTFATGIAGRATTRSRPTRPEASIPGLADAAGNPLATVDFNYQLQPPVAAGLRHQPGDGKHVQQRRLARPSAARVRTTSCPRPTRTTSARAAAPPTAFVIDLSNPVPFANAATCDQLLAGRAAHRVGRQLRRHAPTATSAPWARAAWAARAPGSRIVPGTTVTLYNFNAADPARGPGTAAGGSGTRLVLTSPPGTTLPADYYRLYMPNQVNTVAGQRHADLRHLRQPVRRRVPGQPHLDPRHHRLPRPASQPQSQFQGISNYEDLLSSGTYRSGMSGDGVGGGAFMTGFVVVPTGNIVYARPDYVEDPLLPSTTPDGSLAKPYSALAPEGDPNTAPANPNHDPNGGLNSSQFFLSGFNSQLRPQRQRPVRPLGALRGLATGLQGPGRGRRLAGHAPARSDHRQRSRSRPSCSSARRAPIR